jgi:hypothetical protein
MTTKTHQRAAKGGTLRTVRLDADTLAVLAYLERFANEFIGTKSSTSTIVRRALVELYGHYGTIAEYCGKDSKSAYIYKSIEARVLDRCNSPKDRYGVTPEEVRDSPVLKCPRVLWFDKARGIPSLLENIQADLKRWSMPDE